MRHTEYGNTGKHVSAVGFGGMRLYPSDRMRLVAGGRDGVG